jgi:ornithine cyclodeaminase/alanine dehydrogenase-like protein (mu-crystallin family)
VLILNRTETREVASLPACIDAVESAFAEYGRGNSLGMARVHLSGLDGGVFHLTAGGLAGEPDGAVALKLNGRFPPPGGVGGQRVTGAILMSDAATGTPLALLDSMVVTSLRTAAVTAVVVRALARKGASSALLVGAGRQGKGQMEALAAVGGIDRLAVYDVVADSAEALAADARALGLDARAVDEVGSVAGDCDVVVTITPARAPVLRAADVSPGTLVVALGADGPGKQELEPELLAGALVVVDVVEQAADSGELQHALAAGLMTPADVHAELGAILAGTRPGRTSDDQIVVFDGTGTALQDLAAATLLVGEARRRGLGLEIDLAA